MVKQYKRTILLISEDMMEYLEKFEKILKIDKKMIESIPENQKKKILKLGLFNHGVRELIKEYVDANWKFYLSTTNK